MGLLPLEAKQIIADLQKDLQQHYPNNGMTSKFLDLNGGPRMFELIISMKVIFQIHVEILSFRAPTSNKRLDGQAVECSDTIATS